MDECKERVTEDHISQRDSSSDLKKSIIEKEISEEESKSYMDIQTNEISDYDSIGRSVAESLEEQASLQEESHQSLPSVEISQHADEEKKITEKESITLLSAIEEEKSNSTSPLGPTEPDEGAVANESEESFLLTLNDSTAESTPQKKSGDKKETSESKNEPPSEATSLTSNATSDHAILKENEVLKARITEVNEQLQEARQEIEKLQESVSKLEEETKNPESLTAKLAAQKAESEVLQKEVEFQKSRVQKGAETERELTETLELLSSREKANCTELSEKQTEIKELTARVNELSETVQSLSHNDHDSKNGQPSLNLRGALANDSSRNSNQSKRQRSKVCSIL